MCLRSEAFAFVYTYAREMSSKFSLQILSETWKNIFFFKNILFDDSWNGNDRNIEIRIIFCTKFWINSNALDWRARLINYNAFDVSVITLQMLSVCFDISKNSIPTHNAQRIHGYLMSYREKESHPAIEYNAN